MSSMIPMVTTKQETATNTVKVASIAPVTTMWPPATPTAVTSPSPSKAVVNEGHSQRGEIFYEEGKGYLAMNASGRYIRRDKESIRALLRENGFYGARTKGGNSEVETELLRIQDENTVDVAGEFAGYSLGFHNVNGLRILATSSYETIPSSEGDWSLIDAWINGMFADLAPYMFAHLKMSREALLEGRQRNGPAMAIVGDPNVGKTYFQKRVITPVLGNRSARCTDYLFKKTHFNDDLRPATVWLMDDEVLDNSQKAKRNLANILNHISSTNHERIELKHKPAITLPLYRRLLLILNEEDLDCLSSLEDRLLSKVYLIHAKSFVMPDGLPKLPDASNADEVEAFEQRIKEELPHFLFALEKWPLHEDMRSDRYGVKVVQDSNLVRLIAGDSSENHLMSLLQSCLFTGENHTGSEVTLTLDQISRTLMSGATASEARQYCSSRSSLAALLRSLKRANPQLISNTLARNQSALDDHRTGRWTIKNQAVMQ